MRRHTHWLVVALCLLALVAGPTAVAAKPAPPTRTSRDYALNASDAYEAMQGYFYAGNGLYRETAPAQPGQNPYAYHWPFSQATAATLDLRGIAASYQPAVADPQVDAGHYWDATATPPGYDSYVRPPDGQGGDKYYDDNAWTGLNLVRAYRLGDGTDAAALARAREVFAFAVSGWDAALPCAPGGVRWTQGTFSRDRNTVSTAPNAILALRLYQIGAQQGWPDADGYLRWAVRMYNWVDTNLRDPVDGLYWDHVGVDDAAGGAVCTIERTKWSYNQGTMIGAGVLLAQVLNDPAYLRSAERTARAALAHYAATARGYFSQDPAFNAIYFRNLLLLAAATSDPALKGDATQPGAIRAALAGYADAVWEDQRIHQRTNLFFFQPGYARLVDQGALVELNACLAWDPSRYDLLV